MRPSRFVLKESEMYTKTYTMMSYASATTTSNAVFVGDAAALGLSLQTVAASVVTIQASMAEGQVAAIPADTWSTATVLTANGAYAVQVGMRWLRATQAASSSSATVRLTKQVRVN